MTKNMKIYPVGKRVKMNMITVGAWEEVCLQENCSTPLTQTIFSDVLKIWQLKY